MKVYIVRSYSHDADDVLGVYPTLDAAQTAHPAEWVQAKPWSGYQHSDTEWLGGPDYRDTGMQLSEHDVEGNRWGAFTDDELSAIYGWQALVGFGEQDEHEQRLLAEIKAEFERRRA